jgi:DNA-binding transcriptional regulator YiaG
MAIGTQQLRARLGMSRARFAATFGIPTRTVECWEQGRRGPTGAAATLLRLIDHDPDWVAAALASTAPKRKQPSKRR